MTRRTFGTVNQRDDGRWRARYREAGQRKVIPGSFATKRDALAALEVVRRRKAGTTRTHTTASLAPEWQQQRELEGVRGIDKERALWARIEDTGRTWIHKPAARVTTPDLQRWIDDRMVSRTVRVTRTAPGKTERVEGDRLVSRKTVSNELGLVRLFFGWAARRGLIPSNPATDVEVPKRREARTVEPWTYLERTEIDDVLTNEKIPLKYRALYAAMIFGGLRKGEALGLHWEDVRLDGPVPSMTIRYSYRGPTKAGKVADVPLLPPVVDLLRRWRARDGYTRLRGLVFPNPDNGVHRPDYDCGWPRWKKVAGIDRRVRVHDLRHTCAAHLVSGTWGPPLPLEAVKEWLRHSSITMTQRYAHLRPEALRSYGAELAKYWTDGSSEGPDQPSAGSTAGSKAPVLNIRPKPNPVTE